MSFKVSMRRVFWGLVIVVLGVLLLLDNIRVLDFGDFVARYWPILLILLGLKIILGWRWSAIPHTPKEVDFRETREKVKLNHTFGDVRLKMDSKEFAGGEVSNVFGKIEIDLEEIALKEGNHLLRLNGVFGDLIIVLPKKAPVSVVASTTFGTVRIKDRSSSGVSGHLSYISDGYQEAPGKLFIQAHQVFGDLRVF